MFGWRTRIGFISPTVMEVIPYDFYRIAPQGVGLVGVTCNIDDFELGEYEKGLAMVDNAANYLASRNVDFIIHGGVPLVVTQGVGFDQKLIQRMEHLTGIPSSTSVRDAMDALTHLGVKKVVLVTPYPSDVNEAFVSFLEGYGFQVTSAIGHYVKFKELQNVSSEDVYKFAKDAFKAAPDSDGVYIPCPQWPACDIVDVLEKDIGKPVVASDPADFWASLRTLKIRDPIKGFGRLLASLADIES